MGSARILSFRSTPNADEPLVFGPFWQSGYLIGSVILVGGKSDPASVKIIDGSGESHLCKARRDTLKRLRGYLYEGPIRVTGRGKWFRNAEGVWRLDQFDIEDFEPLEDESLSAAIAQLQTIDGDWKEHQDPLGELDKIRHGDS